MILNDAHIGMQYIDTVGTVFCCETCVYNMSYYYNKLLLQNDNSVPVVCQIDVVRLGNSLGMPVGTTIVFLNYEITINIKLKAKTSIIHQRTRNLHFF